MLEKTTQIPTFIFFGTGHFAEKVLETLLEQGYAPSHIITSPDKPVGRHQILTPSPVKVLAVTHNIQILQPEKLREEETLSALKKIIGTVDVCIVADYGKILPQALLDLSPRGFLNIHPSLLPLLRGPAPLQNTILQDKQHTGITIIKMDALMDHGPIVAQEHVSIYKCVWPCGTENLSLHMAKKSALLLIDTLSKYIANESQIIEQDHTLATYTSMIEKKDAEVLWEDIVSEDTEKMKQIYLKYCAYKDWPEIFFIYKDKRVKVKKMSKVNDVYVITRVIPEGKKEMDFDVWKKSTNL